MRILKAGVEKAPSPPIRFHCSNCGCIYEADNKEYQLFDKGTVAYSVCPMGFCQTENKVALVVETLC